MAKILIVEDEPSIVFVLCELLRGQGYETVSASSGEEGLKKLKEKPVPDLVIIDLNMPGIKGKDVILFMRSDEELKDIPVIIITGSVYNTADFPAECTYQAILEKPFDLNKMLQKVMELVK